MRKTFFILFLLILGSQFCFAQSFMLYGKITNNKLEPLAFASIQLKQAPGGTISKEDGSYALKVERGTYDLMVSMVGFKQQNIRVTVTSNYIQNLILEEDDESNMEDIVIKVKIRDRSEEYIKNVIRNKEAIMNAAGPFSSKVYIKAIQQDSSTSRRNRGKTDSAVLDNPENDLSNMAMAEISLKMDYESDSRMKEERLGVQLRGEANNLFYLSTTAGDFNFYNSLIKVPSISETPFLSPVSYSGLLAYKFKSIKIEKRNGVRVFVISVKPRQISNATVEGEITIQDSSWAILETRFKFPKYHLAEYDFFEVEQEYSYVNDKAWMITRQQFNYYSKSSKRKLSGQTLVTYHDFELNKQFGKKTFGLEISSTAQQAYEQDSSFWETVRTEPLTEKEIRFIRYRDSIYRLTNTEAYLDSLEAVNNKATWKKVILFGQTINSRKKEREWVLPPLISLYEPFQFGGGRLRISSQYFKRFASRKDIRVYTELSYGFRNKDVNGTITLNRMYNPFNRGYYMFDITRGFDLIYSGDALLNQTKKSSYFLNNYLAVGHGLEVLNGLNVYTEMAFALRRDVNGYKTSKKLEELFPTVLDNDNEPVKFDPFNGVYTQLLVKYTPGQRYIREPREKIILGSKWPTFYARYRKGIPGPINSVVDFDFLEFGIEQKIQFGLLGSMRYQVKSGSFLSRKDLRILDYSYQRRGDPWLFMNPDEAFQALDSTFPLFERFYQGHVVHDFNGAFLNKIPLFKKLQLREVAGGGFLIAPEMNLRYAEFFGGVERVFKWPFNPMTKFKLGFYVVGSIANQLNNPVQFKFGFTTWDRKRNKWH